jgi:hypothetical protein
MATSKTRTRVTVVRKGQEPRSFQPAGDAAEQSLTSRRFRVHEGAGRVYVRRPADIASGAQWTDVTDGDGSGWHLNADGTTRDWITRVVDLPSRDSFDLQVGTKEWTGLTVAQLQRLGILDTVTVNSGLPSGAATDELLSWAMPEWLTYSLVLHDLPRNATVSEVRNGTETDVTRPGHWDGMAYVLEPRQWANPVTLLIRYPDGTTNMLSGINPALDARYAADRSVYAVNAAQPSRAATADLGLFGHGAVLGNGGAKTDTRLAVGFPHGSPLPTLGDNGSGSFGIPPPPPPQRQTGFNANTFGILGGGNAPAVSRIDIAGIPEGGRIWVDGIDLSLSPGASWDAAHTAYGVPVIVGAHSIEVVAPSGEKRGATATVGASTLTLPYASMTVTQAAPAGPPARREPVALDRSGVDAGFRLGNQQPPPAATGKGAIAVNNLPQQVTPNDLSAIREDGTSATFATTGTDGRFIASELVPGVWQVRVEEQHGITGSAVPAGSNVNNYVPPVVRSGTVTVTANATAELNFNDMVAVGGMVPHRDDNLAPPEQTSGAVPFSLIAPANFAVSVDGQMIAPQTALTSGVLDGPYQPGAPTHMDRFQTMLAPGTHRVSVRDASAAACYADTRDITVTAGVPASLDYSAPTAAALTACAARNGGATATGQSGGGWWSRRSEGEKVGMVALALTVLGGGAWYYAATRGASSAKKD